LRIAEMHAELAKKDPALNDAIVNHPEFGQTKTRADGMFDLAVNGGTQLLIRYRKAGYLEVQRPGQPTVNDWRVSSSHPPTCFTTTCAPVSPNASGSDTNKRRR
jgi:hypothetical protein